MAAPDFIEGPLAIIGLGLIGGGLARAVRAAHPKFEIIAIDSDRAATAAVRRARIVTEVYPEIDRAIGLAKTIVIATPIAALPKILGGLATHMRPDALLSDVIGVKVAVADLVAHHLPAVSYVGAHPMAGGARSGFANSRADTFRGNAVVISPGPNASPAQVRQIRALWRGIGAHTIDLSPPDHDRSVALTSHLPYLIGICLARLASGGSRAGVRVAGPSFHDVTKRVRFDPEVMAAVVSHNPFMAKTLRDMAEQCRDLADLITDNPRALVKTARLARGRYEALSAGLTGAQGDRGLPPPRNPPRRRRR